MRKISKAIDLLKTKYKMARKQKIYQGKKYKVKYILEENKNSEVLLVLFTSCTVKGQKARYNYMRTVENYDVNKLFILDDFGFDGRGAYYLGKDKDFKIVEDVKSLINSICNKIKPKKEVYIGSSKGAYGALYFALDRKNTYVIAGAPQYMLGNYLNLPGHKEILEYIMGNTCEESIEYLNVLMKKKLEESTKNNTKIFLHYSSEEETYESDLKPLVNEINKLNYDCEFDVMKYNSHAELTKYFPKYIQNCIEKITRA